MDVKKTIENFENLRQFYKWNRKDIVLISKPYQLD